jgi:hypothetical protein
MTYRVRIDYSRHVSFDGLIRAAFDQIKKDGREILGGLKLDRVEDLKDEKGTLRFYFEYYAADEPRF